MIIVERDNLEPIASVILVYNKAYTIHETKMDETNMY